MKFSQYKYLVMSDFYRYSGVFNWPDFIKHLTVGEVYKYIFWMRTCSYFRSNYILFLTLYPFARFLLERMKYKYGLSIPYQTSIASGFYIGHFGGVVINASCKIGKNCNISQGVTLGQANRGRNKGYPVVGDNVYIGPGAKIVGGVMIGDYAAIGANCVVTKDVPSYAVVVGVPGKIISFEGSKGYVNQTNYDQFLKSGLKE